MVEAIEFKDVSFAYERRAVLDKVSFSIRQGAFVGVIGPNGGGKTTLLKLAMGFLQPGRGEIRLLGQQPADIRGQIGYVPQSLQFDRKFPITVLELVLMGRLSHSLWYGRYSTGDVNKALEALDRVGLAGVAEQQFGNLSGGQRQRVLIARSLASEPTILFLDEPTAGVDAEAEEEIYCLLEGLRGAMTILMVTHDLPAVIRCVESVICVQQGVAMLAPEEVCEHFAVGLYHKPLIKGQKGHLQ